MSMHIKSLFGRTAVLLCVSSALCGCASSLAQNSGINLAMHANSKVSAADIGLPAYPGATPYKDKDNDSAVDLGFTFGSFHFSIVAANYVTSDTTAQVLTFYRKALSHYGEVLECDHGKPVGSVTVTGSGLTCSDEHHGNGGGGSSSATELRVGLPNKYRLVGIDKSQPGSTRFALVYLDLPKDSDKGKSAK
jgi:hypothetical protein